MRRPHFNPDQVRWGREVPWHHFGPAPGRWAPEGVPRTPGGRHGRWSPSIARRFWDTFAQRVAQGRWEHRVARQMKRKQAIPDHRTPVQVRRQVRALEHPSPHPMDHSVEAMAAQAEHFNSGGSVMDAPALGLWNYIQATPERFTVKPTNGDQGISPNWTVLDQVTGEVFFVKGSPRGMPSPAAKEVAAAEVMGRAGFAMPPTRLGQLGNDYKGTDRVHGGTDVMIQQDWTQAAYMGPILPPEEAVKRPHIRLTTASREGRGSSLGDLIRRGNDPSSLARMVVFDYLIDNYQDRHGSNVMMVANPPGDHQGGMDLAILDHGLAFGGWNDVEGEQWDFDTFLRRYRGRDWSYSDALLAAAGGDQAVLEQHLREAFEEFGHVDPDKLGEALKAHGVPEGNMEAFVRTFRQRQGEIKKPNAAKTMVSAMGFFHAQPIGPVRPPAKKAARKVQGTTTKEVARQRRNAAARQRRADAAAAEVKAAAAQKAAADRAGRLARPAGDWTQKALARMAAGIPAGPSTRDQMAQHLIDHPSL